MWDYHLQGSMICNRFVHIKEVLLVDIDSLSSSEVHDILLRLGRGVDNTVNFSLLLPLVFPLCKSTLMEFTTRRAWLFFRNGPWWGFHSHHLSGVAD